MRLHAMILGALMAVAACSDRSLGTEWEEQRDASCQAMCEVVSTCDPRNGWYGDPEACRANCMETERLEDEDPCSQAMLDEYDCFSSLTCDELIAYTDAVLAGETEYACKDLIQAAQGACPHD